MTWASFPQVSQPGQDCVCPPASTVDSRHSHTRDDLISYPLPLGSQPFVIPATDDLCICMRKSCERSASLPATTGTERQTEHGGRQSWMQDASPPSGALGMRGTDPLLVRKALHSLPVRTVSSSRAARTTMMCAFKLAEDERGRCSARRGRWKKWGQVHRTEEGRDE